MVQRVKVFRQVEDYRSRVSLPDILFYPEYGVFCPSPRSITKAVIREQRLIDWHELLEYRRWMMRSITVGIPSLRTPPSGFGISTRLTGDGVYFPFRILSVNSWLCSFSHGSAASMVIPSTPGAPLFAFTLL